MRLFVFCTKEDKFTELINDAKVKDIEVETVYYEDLSIVSGAISAEGQPLSISSHDILLIRWPWIIEKDAVYDYNIFVQILLDKYSSHILLDERCLSEYSPFYEDKLFQSFIFNNLGIPTPRTWFFTDIEGLSKNKIDFPVVVKKRISSRSKHNIKIDTHEELKNFLTNKNITNYIFQEYIKAKFDIRINVLLGEILGAVNRDMHIREGNRLAVKGMYGYDLNDSEIVNEIRKVTSYLGIDLAGIDLLITEEGTHYFLEANVSPQLSSFSKTVGMNVFERILDKTIRQDLVDIDLKPPKDNSSTK